jgi:anti-sigma factor RsiW
MNHQQAVQTLASERYLLDEMAELERHAFEEHFFGCAECAADLRAGAVMREGVKAGFIEPPARAADRTSTVVAFPERRRATPLTVMLPWAAAATLAVVAGYQALFVLPGLRDAIEPQALAPVTLRPASRGAEPIVAVTGKAPVTLAIDVTAPSTLNNVAQGGSELTYDLRNAAGATVATGRAPAPAAGTPLLLLVPGSALAAPGRYVLTFSAAGQAFDEYRFVVENR